MYRWLVQWLSGVKHLIKDFVIVALVLAAVFIEFEVGWLAPGRGWETIVANLLPPVALVLLYMLWHLVNAAYQLDKNRTIEIEVLENRLALVNEQWPQRIEKLKQLACYDREASLLEQEDRESAYPPKPYDERVKIWRKNATNTVWQTMGEDRKETFQRIAQDQELTPLAKLCNQASILRAYAREVEQFPIHS
jgi:hypothetical protein